VDKVYISLVGGQRLIDSVPDQAKGFKLGCGQGLCGQCLINVQDDDNVLEKKADLELTTLNILGKRNESDRLACQCIADHSGTVIVHGEL